MVIVVPRDVAVVVAVAVQYVRQGLTLDALAQFKYDLL
jgi:hypothetical protein